VQRVGAPLAGVLRAALVELPGVLLPLLRYG
jgi:hypothetical protein